jgi:hypothetical protein
MSSDADATARTERSFLIDDAARLLGVSRRTVYYRIRQGLLLTIRARCGSQRVLLSSMEALMRGPQEGLQADGRENRQEERREVAGGIERDAADGM